MYAYTVSQWMFLFFVYSLIGWCFESTYVSICQKKLVNRGFMRGPLLPLYGGGAIVMLFSSYPVKDNFVLIFLFGMVSATVLEYVVGTVMEALFKVRYWDYSNQKIQFQGKICLSSSLAWGGFTILLDRVIHPFVERFLLLIPETVLRPSVNVVFFLATIDFTLSVRAALDLRDAMVALDKAKHEMMLIRKRVDVILAFAEDAVKNPKKEERPSLSASLENSFRKLSDMKLSDLVRNELSELHDRFIRLTSERAHSEKLRGFYQKYLIRNNPTMRSKRFTEALEQLKQSAAQKKSKKEKNKKR